MQIEKLEQEVALVKILPPPLKTPPKVTVRDFDEVAALPAKKPSPQDENEELGDRGPKTRIRTMHPWRPEHTVPSHRTTMKSTAKGLTRTTTDFTNEIIKPEDGFDKPAIRNSGKRVRLAKPSKGTEAMRDFEESESPRKKKVSKAPLFAHSERLDFQKVKAAGQE